MNKAAHAGVRLSLVVGVLFAVAALLEPDDLSLSLGFGAASAAFLSIAGVLSLIAEMPTLPVLLLPPGSVWQRRVQRGLRGDALARLQILETLDLVHLGRYPTGDGLAQTRRSEILGMGAREFDGFLREQLDRAERPV